MKTYMFPGQGSQARGMGAGLFAKYHDIVAASDRVLGYSIEKLCTEDPNGQLKNTLYTQPALYVVNALSYFEAAASSTGRPDYLLGHSLGEINALLAAGCFDFETGLRIVHKRAQLMAAARGGAMAAIVGASRQVLETILREAGIDSVDFSNFNTPSQIVISGPAADLERARGLIEGGGMRFHSLNTSGAFHSRYMRKASEELEAYLAPLHFEEPRIPVIANVSARPYEPDSIARTLARQMVAPVQWTDSIRYLLSIGDMQFQEIGHGNVLQKLVKEIRKDAPAPALAAAMAPRMPAAAAPSAVSVEPGTPGLSHHEERGLAAHRSVAEWNRKHPIGTRVTSALLPGEVLSTRTEAVVLFGHRVAVYLNGYRGYFALEDVSVAG